MKIPDEKWYEVIKIRRSRRSYDGRELEAEAERLLTEFLEELNSHVDGFRAVIVKENPDRVFKGAVGSYGKIRNAPAYVAFIGDMSDPNVQEKTGYLGECIILEATALGLGTCWIGGFFDKKEVAAQINLMPQEQVLAVTPVGYNAQDYSLEEKLMSGMAGSRKRKDLGALCRGVSVEALPAWQQIALEAARLAPSAVNRQPWRFRIGGDTVTVSVDRQLFAFGISKRLDCGIAMLHFHVGALHSGVRGTWEYLNEPDVASFYRES